MTTTGKNSCRLSAKIVDAEQGAPRIHGELLMLGFSVSEATVSRYMPPRSRRPGPSWRTFLRNQATGFAHSEYAEERSGEDAELRGHSYADQLQRSAAAQIATVEVGLRRPGQQRPALNVRRITRRCAQRDRGVTHRAASRVRRLKERATQPLRGRASDPKSTASSFDVAIGLAGGDPKRRVSAEAREILSRRCMAGSHLRTHPLTKRAVAARSCARIRL